MSNSNLEVSKANRANEMINFMFDSNSLTDYSNLFSTNNF